MNNQKTIYRNRLVTIGLWLLPLFFFAASSFAAKIEVLVVDCESKEGISDVQIFTASQKFLGSTNSEGKAILDPGNEKINFQKLGYEPLFIAPDALKDICLMKKKETISDVQISSKRLNYYDSLRALRAKNKENFLDYEAILTYSFNYKTTDMKGNILDEAKGYFTVRYQKDYSYPNLFANTNDYAKVIDFHYENNRRGMPRLFDSVKYLDPSSLLCCYDIMEKKFDTPDWWNYHNAEDERETKYFDSENGDRKYVTYRKNNEISRKFYFDKKGQIQKVEVLKPTYFYGSNYGNGEGDFRVNVYYSATLPRVANKYEHIYEFQSKEISYKTTLTIEQCYPQKQTLLIPDENKKNTVFSLIGSFYDLTREIEKAKSKL